MPPIDGKFCVYSERGSFADMQEHELGDQWLLAIDDSLSIYPVYSHGQCVGWLLGVVVDLDNGVTLDSALELGPTKDFDDVWEAICKRCAGSWLFISERWGAVEFRPDACATVGLVYDPKKRRAASHAFLLLEEEYHDLLDEAACLSNAVEQDGWFTSGLTAHHGIYRLLPNHKLSTSTFEATRLPIQFPRYSGDVTGTLDQISDEVATAIIALHSTRDVRVCLTGGHETRALLASLRSRVSECFFVTFDFPGTALDAYLAHRLADLAGAEHTLLPSQKASDAEQQAWQIGVGHTMAGSNKEFFPSVRPLAGQFLIGGLGGEIGRGFLWPKDLSAEEEISHRFILERLKLPLTETNLRATSHWVANLPDGLDAYQTLDLAYLELRMGPWAFAQPQMTGGPRDVHPFISYNQFSRMWSLPPDYRMKDRTMLELVEQCWDDLSQVPVNSYGNWKDVAGKALKAISRPDRAIRKVRQMLSRYI